MGLFDGKVVVITGAGGGIGRSHALAFAREGAKVVVNDLGGTRDGGGADGKMADAVVAEIEALGGEAAAHYESVATLDGATSLIRTAVDRFGGIDILVNNAGILRDKTLLKMEESMWDAVIAVHLRGTFACTQVAARRMVEQERGGRIINTTSVAGLMGNFGQSNYSAAKAGIYGFTRTVSMELRKFGITVNAVAPVAKTRMTEELSQVPEDMKAEHISPMVLFLASEQAADITGEIYGVHGQQIFAYKMKMTEGVTKAGDALWTVEEIGQRLADIRAEQKAPAPAAPPAAVDPLIAAFGLIPQAFAAEKAAGKSFNIYWAIQGGTDHSLILAGDALRVVKGKEGNPSCTVETDAKTVIGIFTGKVRPEQAFMSGKIKASNLADMMAFGQVIDMKKAKALAEQAAAAPTAAGSTGAPAAQASAAPVDAMVAAFAPIPQAFDAAKAKGKKFNIHWAISGGTDHSLILDGETLRVVQGKEGAPSCTVETDADTVIGIFTGKVRPEQAFMSGKIKATNLADMMAFGQVIDMKKAKAIAEQATAAPASAAPASTGIPTAAAAPAKASPTGYTLADVARALPEGFQPDKAKGWNANIFFDVEGTDGFTLNVHEGEASSSLGKGGEPTFSVRIADEKTAIDLLTGQLDPQKAFMKGAITASHLGGLMKFTQAFTLTPPAPPAGPDRAQFIGRAYEGSLVMAERPHMVAYAKAVNDEREGFVAEAPAPIVAHPIYPVRMLFAGMKKVIGDPDLELDVLRLVHGEQDMRFYAPITHGTLLNVRTRLKHVEEKKSGTVVVANVYAWADGQKVIDTDSTFFIRSRGPNKLAPKGDAKKAPAPEAPRGEIVLKGSFTVDEDQPKRYADASLDFNPIHLDPAVARSAGLPGVILHGMCTMAMATRLFIDEAAGGDPTRLKRFAVRFAKPVLPGDTLTTEAWSLGEEDGVRRLGFEVKNQDDVVVVSHGVCEIA